MSAKSGIRWVPVEAVGEVRMGKQLSPAGSRADGQVPYLRVANVFEGNIDYSDVKTMGFTDLERRVYELRPGDILLNEGQESLLNVGRSAIYDGAVGPVCFQNTLIRFRPGSEVIPEYAQAVFVQWRRRGVFARIAEKTSISHLGGGRFAKIPFPMVSISEQKRIVEVLRGLADVERAAEEESEKREAVAESALTRLLSCAPQESEEYVACGDVIKMSGGLPMGQAGVNPAGRYPIVGSSGYAGRGDRQLTGGPTIVIGRVGEGGVGSVRFVRRPAWVTDNALWVRNFSPGWDPEFIAVYLQWFNLRKLRSQTGQPLITQDAIKGVPVPLFSLDGQLRVVRFHKVRQEEFDASREQIEKVRLLQYSVAGKLLGDKISQG